MMIVGIENPLLDISVNVDESFLNRFGLEANSAILASPDHLPLYDEIKKFPEVFYSAGGASQNTIRVAKWMAGPATRAVYIGCVGEDDNQIQMKKSVTDSGVDPIYQTTPDHPTGTCAVLVNGKNRSLVANVGAANFLKQSHLENNLNLILKSQIIYSSGFLITTSTESLDFISTTLQSLSGRPSSSSRPRFVFNLAAPFLSQVEVFRTVLMRTIESVDYLFGNDDEARALSSSLGWGIEDVAEIALRLAKLPKQTDGERTVIITQGPQATVVTTSSGSATNHPIRILPEEAIVDTNGAGDAYAGGFIAGLSLNKPITECCDAGSYAAWEVIQRSGCTLPDQSNFEWSL